MILKLLVALICVVGSSSAYAQGTIPPLQPGELGITGKLRPQYLDSNDKLGKLLDFSDIDEVPADRVLLRTKQTLSDAQVNDLHNTGVSVVAAPGADKAVMPFIVLVKISSTDTDVSPIAETNIDLHWANASSEFWSSFVLADLIDNSLATSPKWTFVQYGDSFYSLLPNQGLTIRSTAILPTAIDGATVVVYYWLFDLS